MTVMASSTRKRKYRYSVECKECNSVFDSDCKVIHMNNMHNGHHFECIAIADTSQSTLSGFLESPKRPFRVILERVGESKSEIIVNSVIL